MQRAVDTIKATDTASAVKENESAEEIKTRLLDPVTDMLIADKVIPNWSIDNRMLSPDAGTLQFYLNGVIINPYVNPEDNNQVNVSEGSLTILNWKDSAENRYYISQNKNAYNPSRTWYFQEKDIILEEDARYYMYLKVPLAEGAENGSIHVEKGFRRLKYYIDDESEPSLYYHIAILEPQIGRAHV